MSKRIAVPNMAGRNKMSPASHGASSRRGTFRSLSFVAVLLLSAACGDSPTAAGESIDRDAVARVMPSVVDARTRLAPSIENVVVRDRVVFDIQQLEDALRAGDAQSVRFHVRVTGNLVNEYMSGRSLSLKEGPDVSGVALMLFKVSEIVNAGYELNQS
jgi:hypothetical protein